MTANKEKASAPAATDNRRNIAQLVHEIQDYDTSKTPNCKEAIQNSSYTFLDLERSVNTIQEYTSRAKAAAQVMLTDFFDKLDPDKQQWEICYEFERINTFCNIAYDYLDNLIQEANKTSDIAYSLINKAHREEWK